MPLLAREANLSETTFATVTGPGEYRMQIFTPGNELSFAGHPSLGTAWALGAGPVDPNHVGSDRNRRSRRRGG